MDDTFISLLKAAVAMENRDEKLDRVYDIIEKDLTLVGQFVMNKRCAWPIFSQLKFTVRL